MTMRNRILTFLTLATLGLSTSATAQNRIGITGGFDVDNDGPYVGLTFRRPSVSLPITFAPGVEATFADDLTRVQGNLDGLFSFPGNSFSPYIGAGLALAYNTYDNNKSNDGDSEVGVGANFLFGTEFQTRARFRPFLQIRATAGGEAVSGLQIGGGLLF